MTTAVSLALNALVTLALSCGLAAPLAAQSQPEAAMIAPAEAPGDWSAQLFRGIAFSLPPGWQEMTRDDEAAMFFGGDVASRTGPGFGLMLDDDPDATFSGSEVTEKGQVMFGNGRTFRRIESAITESGVGMRADILISLVPLAGEDHLILVQSAYNGPLDPHRAAFDGILASIRLPAPGEVLREPVLAGAFVAPVEGEWDTGSYAEDEVLSYDRRDLAGEVSLYRHAADAGAGYLDRWYLPADLVPQPVMVMGQPALLYEWTHPPKRFSDGSDDDAISRVFVFETCLPGPDTVSIGLEGLPSFYRSEDLARLLAGIEVAAGAAPCGAANLPQGAVTGSTGTRPDGFAGFGTGDQAPAPAAKAEGAALDGLLSYAAPEGWVAMTGPDTLTLMHPDGRGMVVVARGAGVLPPAGLAAQVPPGRMGSFYGDHGVEWTQFGWPSAGAEFLDNGQPAEGWHFLNVARSCLPGGEPVALYWAGVSRFLDGDSLRDIRFGLRFNWPEGMEDCPLKDAGIGQTPVDPAPVPPAADPAPEPTDVPASESLSVDEPAEAKVLLPPPPPSAAVTEAPAEPDLFTEAEGGYTLYQNGRYGTFIAYPGSYYLPEPPPGSGDGRTFVSADGASRFIIFTQYDVFGLTQDEMMQQDEAQGGYDSVTYRASDAGWYVLSGHVGADIFYRKVILDPSGLVQVFQITYPVRQTDAFDPVVAYMAGSFGPGTSMTGGPDPAWDDEVRHQPVQVDRLTTPARNTELRKALMAAARAPIEAELGQSIVFVASVLRTDGGWAYLQAVPHRPDGSPIDWSGTRFAAEMRDGVMSDTAMVLMRNSDGGWQVVDFIFGPTDVYWLNWANAYELDEALFRP